MRKISFTIIAFAITAIGLHGCSKSSGSSMPANCTSYIPAAVTAVSFPGTVQVNTEVTFSISFICMNGCGQFGSLDVTSDGTITNVNVIAKYEGCTCTQDTPTRTAEYKFKPLQAGTYFFKFWEGGTSYRTETLTVQ